MNLRALLTPSRQQIVAGAGLAVIVLITLGFLLAHTGSPPVPPVAVETALVAPRLTDGDRELTAFFERSAETPKGGVALFHTDYFKPPPAPKPKPPPPPPLDKSVPVRFRGILDVGEGEQVAYLEVDKRVLTLRAGDTAVAPWKVDHFTADSLVLSDGSQTVEVKFNQGANVKVPNGPSK